MPKSAEKNKPLPHHLIIEGAELTGKSFVIGQLYDFLEKKYNQSGHILDGCHWFNCDVGLFGTVYGQNCIQHYLAMLTTLKNQNVLFEKFHLSDQIYNHLYYQREVDYQKIEKQLLRLNAKIILCVIREDAALIQKRLDDRVRLYPHYQRIMKTPQWYIKQQREYVKRVKQSKLPHLTIDTSDIPGQKLPNILQWLHEA